MNLHHKIHFVRDNLPIRAWICFFARCCRVCLELLAVESMLLREVRDSLLPFLIVERTLTPATALVDSEINPRSDVSQVNLLLILPGGISSNDGCFRGLSSILLTLLFLGIDLLFGISVSNGGRFFSCLDMLKIIELMSSNYNH